MPEACGRLPCAAFELGAPLLVSANALWDARRGEFRVPAHPGILDCDVALDSAGFVATVRYGGYRWTVAQYVELAGLFGWSWWAQMDLCCEPQVAGDRATVDYRVRGTATLLWACRAQVAAWRDAGADWLTDPMPVLQGWRGEDYERSAELTAEVLDGAWPDLVGVGSVCRRQLGGEDGLYALLRHLDAVLPRRVKLHLFGVKGDAVRELARWDRVASVDSMAWDFRSRRSARDAGERNDTTRRIGHLEAWYRRQLEAVAGG